MSESHWAGKTVPQMWASAQAADTQTAWQQVNAWRRTHDLLLHHAGRLQACADELAYAWPPGRSPAAQAFVAYITELQGAIFKASSEAAGNYTALAGVLTSLSAAKVDMARLQESWANYENAPTAEKAHGGVAEQEMLTAKARARMAQNDQEVLEASLRFADLTPTKEGRTGQPKPWGPGVTMGDGPMNSSLTDASGASSNSRMTAPTVKPVDVVDGNIGLAGTSVSPTPPGNLETPTSGGRPGISSSSSTFSPTSGIGSVGRMPIAHSSSIGGSFRQTRPGTTTSVQAEFVPRAAHVSPVVVGRGDAQGRVNPVGGVLEAGRPASSTSALPFMGGAKGAAGTHVESTVALTLHWDVPHGVSPVIEPVPERPFELGPGVIGIDR